MPNWCYNRITVYGNEQTEKIKEIEKYLKARHRLMTFFPNQIGRTHQTRTESCQS